MTTPAARFIGAMSNHRFNPFTGADMSISKTEDHVTVPTGSPFCLQLLEVPLKEIPSTVVVYNYPDAITMTEVETSPILGQYRVDYPSPAGHGTGMIEFNSGDAGKDLRITYKATGSSIVTEFMDTFVPWASPTPGENQGVIFKTVGGIPNTPVWAYFPKRYFYDGEAIYNGAGESESSGLFRFKKGSNDTKVFLDLKGAKLHQGKYSELEIHNHDIAAAATDPAGEHSHTIPDHGHALGTLGINQTPHGHDVVPVAHMHEVVACSVDPGTIPTTEISAAASLSAENAIVSLTGVVAGSGILTSATQADHGHNIPATSTYNTGTSPKTYPDTVKVYIDGVDKTANILALLIGWTKLGDGTDTHIFVTTGTGEMDVTSLLGAGTMHEIRITEPVEDKGGRILLHLEVY
jgi:hypothetical protein